MSNDVSPNGFAGFVSSQAITRVRVTPSTVAQDFVAFDDFTFVSTPVSAAPEPASWSMMILGFGAAGAILRRRRRRVLPNQALRAGASDHRIRRGPGLLARPFDHHSG